MKRLRVAWVELTRPTLSIINFFGALLLLIAIMLTIASFAGSGDGARLLNPVLFYTEMGVTMLIGLFLSFLSKKALEVFVPRMPKGAVIVFDQLNAAVFPGETQAVNEELGIRNLEIRRFPFDSYVSYAVL